jgi:hypothetical protein
MATVIGQRLLDTGVATESEDSARYIKHPPAATCWSRDGMTLDSGTVMVLESNLAHLAHESTRHWVWDPGAGDVNAYKANGWDSGRREGAIIAADQVEEAEISWDRRIARRYGPFYLVCDRLTDTGHAVPRKVRFLWKSASGGVGIGFNQYVALTSGATPPSVAGALAFQKVTTVGDNDVTLSIAAPLAGLAAPPVRCRPDGSAGYAASFVEAVQVYAWFGWHNNTGTYAWYGLTILETR